jgi:hypothetical protein
MRSGSVGLACTALIYSTLPKDSATLPAWDTCWLRQRLPPPTSNPSSRSTPWSAPAAIRCSPRRPAAPAATASPTARSWIGSAPATPLVVWRLGRLGRSLRHLADTVTSLAERRIGLATSTRRPRPPPRRQARVPRVRRLGRVRTRPDRERTGAGLAAARARAATAAGPRC